MTTTPKNISANRPSMIMETSWEVCNKVGGIYAVLSTRSATMIEEYGHDNILFVGPWFSLNAQSDFRPHPESQAIESAISSKIGLPIHIGHWDVPGQPMCILVDYKPLYEQTGALYYEMWEKYEIRGDQGYGDYDESCHFAIAAAMVMDAYAEHTKAERPLGIFNEWTTGMGLLWLNTHAPRIATMFVTHATTVGRSIAGNGKELYKYMQGYHGDQMAEELNVVCKHVIEKKAAWTADAFGTVSEVTDAECRQLLDKPVDQIVYNGFEQGLIPSPDARHQLRADGRKKIIEITRTLYGTQIADDALIIGSSGRSEYRNKGLDVFIDALKGLAGRTPEKPIIAVIAVPSWVKAPRQAIRYGIESGEQLMLPMKTPYITHELYDQDSNPIVRHLEALKAMWGDRVFPIFLPSYLDGHDGVLDVKYYDILPAFDLTVFPSYYEPWGYTPLESMAFSIPSITTDKAGYGMWARKYIKDGGISNGIVVLERSDDGYTLLVDNIANTIEDYAHATKEERIKAEEQARKIAQMADWHHFFPQYNQAFEKALNHQKKRIQ